MTDRDKAVELLARALKRVCTEWLHVIDGEDHFLAAEATAILDQIAPLLTAVKVKPLVWKEVNPGLYIAESILGSWSRFDGHYRPPEAYGGLCRDDPASAAQADYEARILSAVDAVPVAQAVEAERIACTEELRLAVAAARAEERVKTLEAVKDAIQCLANPADIPGGCVIPDTFDEGTSAAFEAVGDMLREATAIRKQESLL